MSVKRIIASLLICGVVVMGTGNLALADGANVVTLGANLTDTQKESVLKYFGVDKNEVVILDVTNQEERKYLEGVAPEEQLGTRTFSCSYVEPTKKGSGINVKTVNLTYVTSSMIASTLATCGISDANVIAMSPIAVSGTGALTGVMKAFEDATGEKLDEEKKEIASEELIITGEISDTIGPDKAAGIVNDIKTEIIKENTKDTVQIAQTIVNITNNYNVNLTDAQKADLEKLMVKIAGQDYDYSQMKETLDKISETVEEKLEVIGESIDKGFLEGIKDTVLGWFESIGEWFGNLFSGADKDLGILGGTNDDLLSEDVVVDATDENAISNQVKVKGFFEKLWDWFTGLFTSEDIKTDSLESNPETEQTDTLIGEDENVNTDNQESPDETKDNVEKTGEEDKTQQNEVDTNKETGNEQDKAQDDTTSADSANPEGEKENTQ